MKRARPAPIVYTVDRARPEQIAAHLEACDASFVPRLSARVSIAAYAAKIHQRALRIEAWSGQTLVGLVAAYVNRESRGGFVTNVSVLEDYRRAGVATALLGRLIEHARGAGLAALSLEVSAGQPGAARLYESLGFSANTASAVRSAAGETTTPSAHAAAGAHSAPASHPASGDALLLSLDLTRDEEHFHA